MALKYFSVYNLNTHQSEDPGNVGPVDGSAIEIVKNLRDKYDKNGIIIGREEFKVGAINLAEQRERMLSLECVGRGTLDGEWKTYAGKVPFTWEAVTPPEA